MINYQEFSQQAKTMVPAGLLTDQWIDCYNRIYAKLLLTACINDLRLNGYDDAAEQIVEHFGVEE